MIDSKWLGKLACPISHQKVRLAEADLLITEDGMHRYRISQHGIPLFAEGLCSVDAARQREHYQRVANQYTINLEYPHTQEYMAYLDHAFMREVADADLFETAEICCGHGELLQLATDRIKLGIGVDISPAMLEKAVATHMAPETFLFVQGDATQLPLGEDQFDSVFMFGGIHHVSDRLRLFAEVFRILRPGGKFYFREPVSDFFLWRWIRGIVYSISPALDAETERPLLWQETVPLLESTGFHLRSWKTYGFVGFCLFMNSDVLIFNRLFRFIPGIRSITRLWARIDDLTVRIPGFSRLGLQVVGVAEKPIGSKS